MRADFHIVLRHIRILIEDVVGASEQASNLTSAASLSRPRPRFLGI